MLVLLWRCILLCPSFLQSGPVVECMLGTNSLCSPCFLSCLPERKHLRPDHVSSLLLICCSMIPRIPRPSLLLIPPSLFPPPTASSTFPLFHFPFLHRLCIYTYKCLCSQKINTSTYNDICMCIYYICLCACARVNI